jgi:hypothetical protein
MRPVIAQKTTTCIYCKEPITPGSERLTDVIRIKPTGAENSKFRYTRRHYHYRSPNTGQSCFDTFAKEQFEKLDHTVKAHNPKGRPPLDMSEEDKRTRLKLLRKLHNQINYYISRNNLDYTKQFTLQNIDSRLVKRAERFHDNLREIYAQLELVGGVPNKTKERFGGLINEPTSDTS